MQINFIPAPIEVVFEENKGQEEFEREFDKATEADEDPIGHWMRIAKARGETKDTNSVVITLLVELHRKLDHLISLQTGEESTKLDLKHKASIDGVHFDHFRLTQDCLQRGEKYYARLLMPTFPKREISIFCEAIGGREAKIIKIHERDKQDWNSYITARERVMIRKMKEAR